MRRIPAAVAAMLLLSVSPPGASGSCPGQVISATADVTVSDGSGFRIESFFGAADQAAIRFVDEHDQVIAVEGDVAWVSRNGNAQTGSDAHKSFALGHQYHALLLQFEALAVAVGRTPDVSFDGAVRTAISGEYPHGGRIHLVDGDDRRRPEGFVFEFPESPRIEVRFDDWRRLGDSDVPFRLQIDDGQRVFDYRYTDIEIARGNAGWFHQRVPAPDLDEVLAVRAAAARGPGGCGEAAGN